MSTHSAVDPSAGAAPTPAAPGRIPGLDGLRAVSVLAVMLYHAHFGWMQGGFLGVEVFFVLSGFLITSLLVDEQAREGRIDLLRFGRRRLLRLVPALAAFLMAVAAYGALCLGDRASQFRLDLLASLGYYENWHQIRSGSSYFADQGLPLLRHLWSLAIEGQFYLVWPFLVAGLTRAFRGRLRPLALLTLLLAALACAQGLRLADPGNLSSLRASASLNRVYLGTDTRSLGLLAGALLALALRDPRAVLGRVLDGAAVLALAGLAGLMCWTDAQGTFLYRGGFLVVDGLTALVVASLALPSASLSKRLLSWRPLEWLGERSYGIYLWHWPLFRLLLAGRTDTGGFLLRLGLAVALTLALAALSYTYLELPIRRGALKGLFHGGAARPPRRRRWLLRACAATVVFMALTQTVVLARRRPYVDEVAQSIQAGAAVLDAGPACPAPRPEPAAPGRTEAPRTPPSWTPGPLPQLPEELKGIRVLAIGDSVMKGAAPSLHKLGEATLGAGRIQINAEECRAFSGALQILRGYKQEKRLGDMVVVHLGTNNSSIPEEQFRKLMGLLSDQQLVLFLTVRSDKPQACESVNRTLVALAAAYPNARVLDWNAAAEAHPDLFYSDLTHLRPDRGAPFYAELILKEIAKPRVEPPAAAGAGAAPLEPKDAVR